MKTLKEMSVAHSANSFLNSFLLEWTSVTRITSPSILKKETSCDTCFEVQIKEIVFYLPVHKFSILGRHHFSSHFYMKIDQEVKKIPFAALILEFVHLLGEEIDIAPEQRNFFLSRVHNSLGNIETFLNERYEDFKSSFTEIFDFKKAEQSLYAGHTFHPTPKSREGFSENDIELYSPEMGTSFPLSWYLIKTSKFFQKSSEKFQNQSWLKDLFLNDCLETHTLFSKKPEEYVPFPVHSWQEKFLLKNESIQQYLQDGDMIRLGPSKRNWFPTSSLRTLYASETDYMLKFSLNLRLTNSLRNLLIHELDRGLQVHEVLMHPHGKEFSQKHPYFEIIHEPVYAGIKDERGEIIQETLFLARFNPFSEDSENIVLATLTQDAPDFSQNRLHHYIQNLSKLNGKTFEDNALLWFHEFLYVALYPLIDAQANYGILLGAHQQNLILEIAENLPRKSYFRDCNGTGYSQLGHSLFSNDLKSLDVSNGNILGGEVANYLFGYYLIINSTFNVISSIAHSGLISEETLIMKLRSFLEELRRTNPKDPSFINYLLSGPNLMHKGNFFCSLKNINENTEKDPLNIYTKIPNPILWGNKMSPDLKETSYSILSSGAIYKAIHINNQTTISGQKDETLILKTEFIGSTLRLNVLKNYPSENKDLLMVAIEYLLGHYKDILLVEISGTKLARSDFFQRPELWHHRIGQETSDIEWTSTNGRSHPIRLLPHEGVVYKRYLPELEQTITFRSIDVSKDLDIFHDWHNQPRVSCFWELNKSKDELKTYLENGKKDLHQFPMIVEIDGESVGYYEMYWVMEDRLGPYYESGPFDRGFHFLIGNEKFLGGKITDLVIRSGLHFLFLDEPRTQKIMAEPRHDNQRVLRYAEASKGWKKIKEFDFPHKRAALLECDRERFFSGDAL